MEPADTQTRVTRAAAIFGAAFCSVVFVVLWIANGGLWTGGHSVFAQDSSYVVNELALLSALIAAFVAVPRLRGRQRLAWYCVGAAFVGQMVPWTANLVYVVVMGRPLADVPVYFLFFEAIALPAAMIGAGALISAYTRLARVRTVLDALISTGAIYAVTWVIFLRNAFHQADSTTDAALRQTLYSGFGQLAATVSYGMILAFLIVKVGRRDRTPLVLFALGVAATTLTSVLPFLFSGYSPYLLGRPLEVIAFGGTLLTAMASIVVRPVTPSAPAATRSKLWSFSSVPYLAVLIAAVAIGADAAIHHGQVDVALVWDGVLIMVLLSARQYLALGENERLAMGLEERSRELLTSEERFRELVQNSSDIITVLAADGTVKYISPAVRHLLGIEAEQLVGGSVVNFVHAEDQQSLTSRLDAISEGNDHKTPINFRVQDKSGGWRMLEAVPTNLLASPSVEGIVLNTRDVTERHELEDQLRHQAFHDPLTGLANRALLHDRLRHALSRSARTSDITALVLIDLDDFKTVNDSLGHAAGDDLLTSVAKRMTACLRDSDTAARLGGDEFAVLLENNVSDVMAANITQRLLNGIERTFRLDEQAVTIRASAGIALADAQTTAEDLLRRADVAMYRAKGESKGRFVIFDESMEQVAHQRLRLQQELTRALERGEFFLHYQPVVRVDNAAIESVEALIRWQHPERGLVPPLEFISAAEETGLIVPISQWVLQEACAQAKAWHMAYPDRKPISMAVNISARHLQTGGFVDDVLSALRSVDLDPTTLTLELTESAVIADLHGSIRRLHAVRELGVQIALDDFGTGYSSFGYLRDLPVDILKIDRSFLTDLGNTDDSAEFIRAIQTLSHSLHLLTVAEGVEELVQVDELKRLHVDHAQGFYFARPTDPNKLLDLFAKHLPKLGATAATAETPPPGDAHPRAEEPAPQPVATDDSPTT